MRRLTALVLVGALTIFSACGSGAKSSDSTAAKQLTDPRTAPTATLPAVLPSPVLAGTVTSGSAGSAGTTTPSVYTVKANDTLAAIATQFGIPLAALVSYNNDVNPSALKVGQEIRIPPPTSTSTPSATPAAARTATPGGTSTPPAGRTSTPAAGSTTVASSSSTPAGNGKTYSVQSGDTACKLAGNFQVSVQELAEANGTTPAALANLKVGQQLKVPAPTGSPRGC
jgi:LysM repeat protein